MPIGREISVMNQVGYKELFLRDVMSGQSETKIKRPSVTPMEMTLSRGQEGNLTGTVMCEERQNYEEAKQLEI